MIALALLLQAAAPLAAPVVPDPELGAMRGGVRLPNGVDVALTVQSQTSVDGRVVLQSVFRADQGTPTFTVFAPRAGEPVAAPAQQSASAAANTNSPTISYDSRNGLQVTPGQTIAPVAIAANAQGASALTPGLEAVSNGAVTDNGVIATSATGPVRTVELQAADLRIVHLAGAAFGAAVTNMGSDRTIDTATSVSIDLRNAGPDVVGSAMFRVQDVALDALALRGN